MKWYITCRLVTVLPFKSSLTDVTPVTFVHGTFLNNSLDICNYLLDWYL
jgi:hypothetical protein